MVAMGKREMSASILDRQREDGDSTWNVLTQVLLPLIIILAFVAVMEVERYRVVTAVTQDENERLDREMERVMSLPENVVAAKNQSLIIEIQKLRLIQKLDEVIDAERSRMGFTKVFRSAHVSMHGIRPIDAGFKSLCDSMVQAVEDDGTRHARSHYQDLLYARILDETEIVDGYFRRGQNPGYVDHWVKADVSANVATGSSSDARSDRFIANEGVLTTANRRYLAERLVERIIGMVTDLVALQSAVLHRIYGALMEEDYQHDRESRRLAHKLATPSLSEQERQTAMVAFIGFQNKQIKNRLEHDGYRFLVGTWESVSVSLEKN